MLTMMPPRVENWDWHHYHYFHYEKFSLVKLVEISCPNKVLVEEATQRKE